MAKKAPPAKVKPKAQPEAPRLLLYKVVELSNVDESSMEDTVNTWVSKGWTFDGVQFAMRESSKRPSMAFVFFTRPGSAADEQPARAADDAHRNLRRLAEPVTADPAAPKQPVAVSPWERLAQLAEDDDVT
jgi:hypothetical protein